MQGYMPAARRLAQLPEKPQHLADGGAVGFGARGLAGLRQMIPLVQAMGYPQQQAAAPAPTPAPAPVSDPRAAQLQAMIPRMEAMGYKQQPQYLAKGGMVRGPGTGTSDSIPDEVEPGTYIMPADSTQAIGPNALEKMGKMPVRLSNGEYKLPPEQVMAIGEAVLKFMKDATHTPVNGEDGGQTDAEVAEARGFAPGAAERLAEMPEQLFADGGLIENDVTRVGNSYSGGNVGGSITVNGGAPAGTFSENPGGRTATAVAASPAPAPAMAAPAAAPPAPAAAAAPAPQPAAPMGWADSNARRNAEVSAASITNRPEWSKTPSRSAGMGMPPPIPSIPQPPQPPSLSSFGYQPRRYADGGTVEDRAVFGFYPQIADHGKTTRATQDKLQQGVQATGPATFQPAAPAAEPPPAPAAQRMTNLTDPRSTQFAGTPAPAPAPAATASGGALSRAATILSAPAAPSPAPLPSAPVSAQNMGAADSLARRGAAEAMANMPNAPKEVQAPVVRHSGNDWQARNDLRNALVSASSITANGGRFDRNKGESPESLTYRAMLGTDQELRNSVPGLAQQAMREQGDTQRARLQASAQAAEGAANRQNDWNRSVLKEQGDYARTGLQADAMTEAARTKAAAAGQKPATEAERLSSGYAQRMIESTKFIDRFEKDGKAGVLSEAARGLPVVGGLAQRIAMTKEQQQYRQGQEDWVRAKLRKESGAVIGDGEMQREIETYFPMPGDTPEVIQQKRASRSVAVDAMKANAGAALPEQYRQQQTAALPTGMSRQVGTSGGKPVYEDAQGNRFIGG